MPEATLVLVPTSPEEAVAAFRAAAALTVVGGGTVTIPDIAAGRTAPAGPVLLLWRAGLDTVARTGGVVRLGAGLTLDRLHIAPAPIGEVARQIGDREVRAQATLGGNLCVRPLDTAPRGDLQVPLVALQARVEVAGANGTGSLPVERYLAERPLGLVLTVEVDDVPRLAATARLDRPHTHSYTALHVCAAARSEDGVLREARVVVGGLTGTPLRLPGVEAVLEGRRPGEVDVAEASALAAGLEARTDALASGWYRARVAPVLVARALNRMLGRAEERA